jgi:multimeric flavodoxin WrbA
MNILILQGSPRANENTAWMAEEYRKAAEAAGHKVILVDVAHKKIGGCIMTLIKQ